MQRRLSGPTASKASPASCMCIAGDPSAMVVRESSKAGRVVFLVLTAFAIVSEAQNVTENGTSCGMTPAS